MKNIEIEIRIFIEDDSTLKNWLKHNATFVGNKYQHDIYFEPKQVPFIRIDDNGFKDADEWLRIRVYANSGELCYKKWHRDSETKQSLYADEVEVKIDKIDNLKLLLEYLDYNQISEVKKNRESWSYDNFLIEKDEIENLGVFYEIEFKGDANSPQEGLERIYSLLKNIGIRDWKIIDRGYPWMQWNENWHKMMK